MGSIETGLCPGPAIAFLRAILTGPMKLGGCHVASVPAGLANSKVVLHGLCGHTDLARYICPVPASAPALPSARVAPLRLPRQRFSTLVARCQQNAVDHSSPVASDLVYVQGAGVASLKDLQNDDVLRSTLQELSERERAAAAAPPRLVPDHAESQLEKEAWELLRSSVVSYCGSPVGTLAACDPTDTNPLNYDQVFIRDFIPSAIAFLLKGEHDIVRNFILNTLQLQVRQG